MEQAVKDRLLLLLMFWCLALALVIGGNYVARNVFRHVRVGGYETTVRTLGFAVIVTVLLWGIAAVLDLP